MGHDLKHAVRLLAARPGWTAVAVLSLAVGIGLNTTAFSVADALLLRPLPVERPDELVELSARAESGRYVQFSFAEYGELRAQVSALQGLVAFSRRGTMLNINGESELVPVVSASGNYFEMLGVRPHLGRLLRSDLDSGLDAQPAAVISHSLWQRRFGGDPAIVGRLVRFGNARLPVVGVAPAEFNTGLQKVMVHDLWVGPAGWLAMSGDRSEFLDRKVRSFELIGRLAPGVNGKAAHSQAAAVGARLRSAWTDSNRDINFHTELISHKAGRHAKVALLVLLIVGLVLWIACGNVAGLVLAQSEERRREIGIRQAMGASRWRLIRQMLTECALLAVLGMGAGLLLAQWLLQSLPALLPPVPFQLDAGLRLDVRVFGYTAGMALLTVLLVGLAPALRAARVDIMPVLKGSMGQYESGHRSLGRAFLVAAQVALAVVLLNTSGLLLRSFLLTQAESPGFDTARNLLNVLIAPETRAAFEQIRERAAALPGVRRATLARRIPMSGSGGGAMVAVEFPGLKLPEDQRRTSLRYNQVGTGYFEALGTRILRGRGFTDADHAQAPRVALISEVLARTYFPNGGAVDRSLLIEGNETRIAGVVEDARINGIHERPEPFVYLPFAQYPTGEGTLIVESVGDPGALTPAVKAAIQESAPGSIIYTTVTMRDHMKSALFLDWVQAVISIGVASLGVLLAGVGLFAAVSYSVGRRIPEFGLRLALGAGRRDVFSLVLRQSFLMTTAGAGIGLIGAFFVARLLQSQLYGVTPGDPLTLLASVLFALAIALVASLQPAARAVRVDPVTALRCD
jgi:predicted permease